MPRHIELRDDADAAVARVRHDVAHLRLCVIQPVRAHALQPRVAQALHAEPLVLREMPVQHVELDRRHAVEGALDHLDRLEVPADIHQQSAPREARRVLDVHGGHEKPVGVAGHELQQRLEAAEHADDGRRPQRGPRRVDVERVGLVLGFGLGVLPGTLRHDQEPPAEGIAAQRMNHAQRGAVLQPIEQAGDGALEARIRVPGHRDRECGVERDAAGEHGQRARDRHQVEGGRGGLVRSRPPGDEQGENERERFCHRMDQFGP